MDAIQSSGADVDPQTIITNMRILLKDYFIPRLPEEDYLSALRTYNFFYLNLVSNFIKEFDLIDLTVSQIFEWGLTCNVSTAFKNKELFLLFSEVIAEYVSLLSTSSRKQFIIELLNAISRLFFAKSDITFQPNELRIGNPITITMNCRNSALISCLSVFNSCLKQLIINVPNIIYLFHDLLQTDDTIILLLTLKCLSNYVPLSLNERIKKIRLLALFYINQIQNIDKSLLKPLDDSFIDSLLTKSFQKASSALNEKVNILLGRELLSFLSFITSENIKYPNFLEQIFEPIFHFAKNDTASLHMISQLILSKFEVFYKISKYVDICKFISQNNFNFTQQLQKNYLSNPKYLSILIQIIPNLDIPAEMLIDLPMEDVYQILSKKNVALNDDLLHKLNQEIRQKRCLPTLEQFKEIVKFIPFDIISDKFAPADLAVIYEKYPNLLDDFLAIWVRYVSKERSLPFICLLAKRAHITHNYEHELGDYIIKVPNTLEAWSCPQYRDVLEFYLTPEEIEKRFEELLQSISSNDGISIDINAYKEINSLGIIKNFNGRCIEIENMPDDLCDFILQCKPIATKFFLKILEIFLQDGAKSIAMATSINILKRSTTILADIYYQSKYDSSFLLYEIDRASFQSYQAIARLIFKKINPTINLILNDLLPLIVRTTSIEKLEQLRNFIVRELQHLNITNVPTPNIQSLVINHSAEILEYLFLLLESDKSAQILTFITNVVLKDREIKPSELMEQSVPDLISLTLLDYGNENPEIQNRALKLMNLIVKVGSSFIKRPKIKNTSTEDSLNLMWYTNLSKIYFDFGKIFIGGCAYQQKLAIRTMTRSIESLNNGMKSILTKLLGLVSNAMSSIQDDSVKLECFTFYEKFMKTIDDDLQINYDIFCHLVSQIIPNIKEFPKETCELLKLLCIEREKQVKDYFYLIAIHNALDIYPEFHLIKETVSRSIIGKNWIQHTNMLMEALNHSSPSMQVLLIQQIIEIFKSDSYSHLIDSFNVESADITSDDTDVMIVNDPKGNKQYSQSKNRIQDIAQFPGREQLGIMLWQIVQTSTRKDLQILCARLLSMILPQSLVNQPMALHHKIEKKDVDQVMHDIISNHLVHVLEDPSMFINHDSVSCAIQIMLEQLGCSQPYSNTRSSKRKTQSLNERGKANWDAFDPKVQAAIERYKTTKYSHRDVKKIHVPIFPRREDKEKWLAAFTTALLQVECDSSARQQNAEQLKCITFIIIHVPQISSSIIPYLCYWQRLNPTFQKLFHDEFHSIYDSLVDQNSPNRELARACMQIMFNIFDSIAQLGIYPSTDNAFCSVTYFNIASNEELYQAAFYCQLYTHALMYLELAIRQEWEENEIEPYQLSEERIKQMKKIYKHLNESDGMEILERIQPKNAMYDESLSVTEMRIFNSEYSDSTKMADKYKISYFSKMLKTGRYERTLHEAFEYRNSNLSDRRIDAIIARAATKLARWDSIPAILDTNVGEENDPNNSEFSYNSILDNSTNIVDKQQQLLDSTDIAFSIALYYLDQQQYDLFKEILNRTRSELIEPLQQQATVSFDRMLPTIMHMHIIEELDDFASTLQKSEKPNLSSWKRWTDEMPISIDDYERLAGIHCALLQLAYDDSPKRNKIIAKEWLEVAKISRKSGQLFRAQIACSRASQYMKDFTAITFESAKICHSRHEINQAISIVTSCLNSRIDLKDKGKAIYLRALWNAEDKSMEGDELSEEYAKAAKTIEKRGKAYYALASLSDQRISSFMQFLDQVHIEGSKRTTNKFWGANTTPAAITDLLRVQLPLALENYKLCITYSPQFADEVVPRILQIFFDIGKYFTSSPEVTEIPPLLAKLSSSQKEQVLFSMIQMIQKCQTDVKSAVWLNSITQLISRVEQPQKLEQHLFEFIKIALTDYPQPAFWHLLSIKHSVSQTRQQKFAMIIEKTRIGLQGDKVATFDELRNQYEKITDGLRKLATTSPGSSKTKAAQSSVICQPLVQAFNNCKLLMPLSKTLSIHTSSAAFKDYTKFENNPGIAYMEDDIYIFSSLQRPKRINLKGTDGKQYHFLCKKDDDLRKDMRMMEFASFVNRVLNRDRRCRERALSIVTFAVICLDECCGILEWCEHTKSFRTIIDDLYKMHKKGLNKNQILQYFCENENSKSSSSIAEKKKKYFREKVLPAYPPYLHEWFLKRFSTPAQWFQSRLNFNRSTAVWSMVGFIIGLGDRHTENILFNEDTGGVVHCDFNCMFDKAKTLPTPECVPFRLTQNFVDAMGVLGTNGPFSQCSTFVLDALRQKKQKLVSVLQTFVHDPLLEWKKGNQTTAISTAKMVLKEVERRLSGFSEDKTTFQSPECVVRALIKQSTDNNNLALMYVGWQPYL